MSNRLSPLYALVILAALLLPIWSALSTQRSVGRIQAIKSGDMNPLEHAQRLSSHVRVEDPAEWEATARALYANDAEQSALTITLLERALASAPSDYQAWAFLAFVRQQSTDRFTAAVDADLNRSFEACPYCDKSLLRWRFTFVLANWDDVSEVNRMHAFSGADFLRWWHLDYDYLEDVRQAAMARNIPFDTYRRKIDTPARPNEIGLGQD